jgi:predicted lipoprotein with Yx(FWY)xxD motif
MNFVSSRGSRAVGLVLGALALGALTAACGSSTSATQPPAVHAVVKTTTNGTLGTILTSSGGFAVYHRTSDPANTSTCTGACPTIWPPVLVHSASNLPVSGMTGFGTTTRADGSLQLTYKGEPLYTYTGDSSAGQTNGQGFDGIWYVVTTAPTSTGGGSTTTTSGGGYHY